MNFKEVNSSTNVKGAKIRLLEPAVRAIDFSLPRIDSSVQFHSKYNKNKVGLLCFWSANNYMSEAAITHLELWYRSWGLEDINIIAINVDPTVPSAHSELGVSGVIQLWDKDTYVKDLFQVSKMPSTVLIDKAGMIRDEKTGGPLNDWMRLESRIKELLNE